MTWVTWKEFRILLKTDIEDLEEVIASFGKNLLPWEKRFFACEKRFLARAEEYLRKKRVTNVIGIAIGVLVGIAIGNAIIWIVSLF